MQLLEQRESVWIETSVSIAARRGELRLHQGGGPSFGGIGTGGDNGESFLLDHRAGAAARPSSAEQLGPHIPQYCVSMTCHGYGYNKGGCTHVHLGRKDIQESRGPSLAGLFFLGPVKMGVRVK